MSQPRRWQKWQYVVLALDLGATKTFGLGLVWPDFHSQRHPPW